jgi:prefoldin alpha subunit
MSKKAQLQLNALSVEQLRGLKDQFEGDVESLTRALDGLRAARNRFTSSKELLDTVKTLAPREQMLVPLTSSLYVMGTIKDTQHVLVDVGTGYFIRHSVPRAQAFFEKRSGQMRDMMENVGGNIAQKQASVDAVIETLQGKLQAMRDAPAQ